MRFRESDIHLCPRLASLSPGLTKDLTESQLFKGGRLHLWLGSVLRRLSATSALDTISRNMEPVAGPATGHITLVHTLSSFRP